MNNVMLKCGESGSCKDNGAIDLQIQQSRQMAHWLNGIVVTKADSEAYVVLPNGKFYSVENFGTPALSLQRRSIDIFNDDLANETNMFYSLLSHLPCPHSQKAHCEQMKAQLAALKSHYGSCHLQSLLGLACIQNRNLILVSQYQAYTQLVSSVLESVDENAEAVVVAKHRPNRATIRKNFKPYSRSTIDLRNNTAGDSTDLQLKTCRPVIAR